MFSFFDKSTIISPATLNVASLLAPIIGSRDVVQVLKQEIEKQKSSEILLDLSRVEFISRSAAHELLLVQEAYSQKGVSLEFVQANEDVAAMLRTVAANRALPLKDRPSFQAETADINTLLEEVGA